MSLCVIAFLCPTPAAEAEGEREVDTPTRRDGDPKTEINKLFSSLKASSSSASSLSESGKTNTKPRGWRELSRGPLSPPVSSHASREVVVEVLKELDAWSALHNFCGQLPVFETMGKDKVFLSSCVGERGYSIENLVERCVFGIKFYYCG